MSEQTTRVMSIELQSMSLTFKIPHGFLDNDIKVFYRLIKQNMNIATHDCKYNYQIYNHS